MSELMKANPHQGVKRGNELAAAKIVGVAPMECSLENSGEICSVCRAEFGSFGFNNVQPYAVTVDKPTSANLANTRELTVCAKCIEVFGVTS